MGFLADLGRMLFGPTMSPVDARQAVGQMRLHLEGAWGYLSVGDEEMSQRCYLRAEAVAQMLEDAGIRSKGEAFGDFGQAWPWEDWIPEKRRQAENYRQQQDEWDALLKARAEETGRAEREQTQQR